MTSSQGRDGDLCTFSTVLFKIPVMPMYRIEELSKSPIDLLANDCYCRRTSIAGTIELIHADEVAVLFS